MNIMFVTTRGDHIGGSHKHIIEVAKYLQSIGLEVTCIFGYGNQFAAELDACNLRYQQIESLIHKLSLLKDLKALIRLVKIIKRNRPDLISVHSFKSGLVGRFAGLICRIPVVYTVHGWHFSEGNGLLKRILSVVIEGIMSHLTSAIICVCKYDYRLLQKQIVFKKNNSYIIHNGVSDTKFDSELGNYQTIVMIARFDRQKNQLGLIKSCMNLQNDWSIIFIGTGPTEDNVKEYCELNGIGNRVSFLGFQSDVTRFLGKGYIFCLWSNYEGFPISSLEAMMMQTPVIVSDCGGSGEAVNQGETGFVVARNNSCDLTKILDNLIGDKREQDRLGMNGRLFYEKCFTSEQMSEKTLSVFKKVCGSQ